MLARVPPLFALTDWTTLLVAGVGVLVAALVAALAAFVSRWRRRKRLAEGSREEDLSWEDLLELLRQRPQGPKEPGPPEDVPADQLLDELVAALPARARRAPGAPEEPPLPAERGAERRA